MERRFEVRKREILKEANIKPQVANGMLKRLEQFAQPFIASFDRREPKENAQMYMCGLLSDLGRKNIESIAYRYDQQRRTLQRFIGTAPWDHQPLQQELARQIGIELGEDDGVIVFDPSGHKKCGNNTGINYMTFFGRKTIFTKKIIELIKQFFDKLCFCKLFSKQPDGFGIGNHIAQRQLQKSHEGEPVSHLKFNLVTREVVQRLQYHYLEHKNNIKRPSTGVGLSFFVPKGFKRCEIYQI